MINYQQKLRSKFYGIMQWSEYDSVFLFLNKNSNDWYFYDIDKDMPILVLDNNIFIEKIIQIQKIIKNEHKERYCGIVYVDNIKTPTMVKIFHPKNLGKSCGSSENPPLPKWVISQIKPTKIEQYINKSQSFLKNFIKL